MPVGFGILVLISIVVGISAYLCLTDIQGNLNKFSERRSPVALLVDEMAREFLLMRIETINWLADSSGGDSCGFVSKIDQAKKAYDDASNQAENFHKTPAGCANFEKVLEVNKQYDSLHQQLIALLQSGKRDDALAFRDSRFAEARMA